MAGQRQSFAEVVATATALNAAGRLDEALTWFDRAARIAPRDADILDRRGVVLARLGRSDDALRSFDRAIAAAPGSARPHVNRATVLAKLDRTEAALASYEAAIACDPGHFGAHYNRGGALLRLGRTREALASFDRAIAINPFHVDAIYNRGNALATEGRVAEAIASFERAIALAPGHADAWNGRGNALKALQRRAEALDSFEQALLAAPEHVAALCNAGWLLAEMGRFDDGLACLDRAIALSPGDITAHYNRAMTLRMARRPAEAIASFDRVIAIDPGHEFAIGERLHCRMLVSDWTDFETERNRLTAGIDAGRLWVEPFVLTSIDDDRRRSLAAARLYNAQRYPAVASVAPVPRRPGERLRIGYFSPDFRDHPVMHLTAELFEAHDRDRFEVIGFGFGPFADDAWRARAVAAFDGFEDVTGLSDVEAAARAQALGLDIAVDLTGYTAASRPSLFAARAAPVQVSCLGYPGTMGAPYIDYIIADERLVPATATGGYAEAVAWLPDCYQPNARFTDARPRGAASAFGLPDGAFVFCAFNQNYKILPDIFAGWMAMLRAVPDSVLWLRADDPVAQANLRAAAAGQGIDTARLAFALRSERERYLAQLAAADLFLDTTPYNAHATASDALHAGLPVLTLAGETYAARVGVSLLHAVGLPELVTHSLDDYVQLGIALGQDTGRLTALRERLRATLPRSPLFDPVRYARHLEAAFEAMIARHRAGKPPAAIRVEAMAQAL